MQLRELDDSVTYIQQLQEAGTSPVVLVNVFTVPPESVERFLEVWAEDARFMQGRPGFVSAQLHRGTAGSNAFVNVAEWESGAALLEVVGSPEFLAGLARYPEGVVASPHVFQKVAVPGICPGADARGH